MDTLCRVNFTPSEIYTPSQMQRKFRLGACLTIFQQIICNGDCHVKTARFFESSVPTHLLDYRHVVHKVGQLSSFASYQRSFVNFNKTTERNDDRRHSFPFVTGDGFRSLSDIVVDTPGDVANACYRLTSEHLLARLLRRDQAIVIFVANDGTTLQALIDSQCVHDAIRPVVVVSHNGDADGISPTHPLFSHDKVRALFAQNCDGRHEKMTCIPIGLENRRWPRHGMVPEILAGAMVGNLHGLSPADVISSDGAYIAASCFTPGTYPSERVPLAEMINDSDMAWIDRNCRHDAFHFYRKILASAAVIAPRGNGKDTHRAWESLYLGRVVVTLSSSMDRLWDGLPVLLIRNWSDMSKATVQEGVQTMLEPRRLKQLHENTPKLFMDYWACLIGEAAHRKAEYCTLEGLKRVFSGP